MLPVISHVRNVSYGIHIIMCNHSTIIIDSCLIRIESCFSAQGIYSLNLEKDPQNDIHIYIYITCQPCPRNFHRNSKTNMGTRSQNRLFDTIKMIKVALNSLGRWVQPRLAHRRKSQKTRIFSDNVIQRGMPAGYACLLLSRKSTHIFHGL